MYGIFCGTFIDGTGKPFEKNVWLYVKDDRIINISKNKLYKNLQHFDASHMTVMPGLIDSHKHILNCGGSGMGVGLNLKTIYSNINNMEKSGVTSFLDLGSAYFLPKLETLLNPKVRIFNAISIITCPDGYPAEYMPKKFYKLGSVLECDSFESIYKTVKKLHKKGVSCIKTAMVSRSFSGQPINSWDTSHLKYLVDVSHGYGLKVCAHVTYACDYEKAAICGVDSVHHAAFDKIVEDDILNLMIAKGIQLVPTISLSHMMFRGLEEQWILNSAFSEPLTHALRENLFKFTNDYFSCKDDEPIGDLFINIPKREFMNVPNIQFENLKKYISSGGSVAMGTDSALGFSLHEMPAWEVTLLNSAGLSVEKTISASTYQSARVFGKEDEIGSLEIGKKADILIVHGNLTENIHYIKDVDTVIIDGKFVKRMSL